MPASHAFWTISKRRPAADRERAAGERQPIVEQHRSRRPCRRRCAGRRPRAIARRRRSRSNSPAACSPPVSSNTRCRCRSASGSDAATALRHRQVERQRRGARPQRVDRHAAADAARRVGRSRCGARRALHRATRRAVAEQKDVDDVVDVGMIGMAAVLDRAEVVGGSITPSASRNPAASSRSSPGVRMMTANGRPCSRTSSGSSTAAVSAAGRSWPRPARPTRVTDTATNAAADVAGGSRSIGSDMVAQHQLARVGSR